MAHSARIHARSTGSHERWLVSYADFITLLFAFFVVLYATSKADLKKQRQVSQAINLAFQTLGMAPHAKQQPNLSGVSAIAADDTSAQGAVMSVDVLSPAQVKDDLDRIRREVEKRLAKQLAQRTVAVHMGPDGLVISLREAGFFPSGSAAPEPEARQTLEQIAGILGQMPYNMRVEGHTDNIPIHTSEFDSNWELSSVRATHIARLLLDLKAISPDRLSAAGYAEFHPVASNDTAEGRSQNRRIDLLILPRTKADFRMADGGQSTISDSRVGWEKVADDDP